MMRMKRVLAILLFAVMLLGSLPVAAVTWLDENVSVAVKDDKTVVTVSGLSDEVVGKTVICGWYLDEVLQDIRMGAYLAAGISLTSTVVEYDEVKCFLWENMRSVQPITDARSPELTEEKPTVSSTFSAASFSAIQPTVGGCVRIESESGEEIFLKEDANLTYNGFSITPEDNIPITAFFGTDSSQSLITPESEKSVHVRLGDVDADNNCSRAEMELAVPVVLSKVNKSEGSEHLAVFTTKVWIPIYSVQNKTWSVISRTSIYENEIAELSKDGVTVAWNSLKSGDVVMLKPNCDGTSFCVEVLGGSAYVNGYVSAADNEGGEVKLSNGRTYKVSQQGYGCSGLKVWDSGTFWIYRNEVVWYEASGYCNYGYILNATDGENIWGLLEIQLQLLSKENKVLETTLASSVRIKNLNTINTSLATVLSGSTEGIENFVFRTEDLTVAWAKDLSMALAGKLVAYETNSAGEIVNIVFGQMSDEEESMYLCNVAKAGSYDERDMMLDGIEIDADTYIFYITNAAGCGTMTYGTGSSAAKRYSRVDRGGDLVEGVYTYIAFDTGDGIANAVVIMNTTGEISPSAPVAVIEKVFAAELDGNPVWSVTYLEDGEKKTTVTASDLSDITESNAKKGDVFQLRVSNGIIIAASKVFTMTRNANNTVTAASVSLDSNKTGGVFGAIYDENARGNLKLRLNGADSGIIRANDAETANVYVVDPNKKSTRQIKVGSLTDAYVDENLTEPGNKIDIDSDGTVDVTVDGNGNADYLLDYAYAYQYRGEIIDIVIYKPYTFTYTVR